MIAKNLTVDVDVDKSECLITIHVDGPMYVV